MEQQAGPSGLDELAELAGILLFMDDMAMGKNSLERDEDTVTGSSEGTEEALVAWDSGEKGKKPVAGAFGWTSKPVESGSSGEKGKKTVTKRSKGTEEALVAWGSGNKHKKAVTGGVSKTRKPVEVWGSGDKGKKAVTGGYKKTSKPDEVWGSGDKGKKTVTGGYRKTSKPDEVWGSGDKGKKTVTGGYRKTSEPDEVSGSGGKGKKAVAGGFRKVSEPVKVWGSGDKGKKAVTGGYKKTSKPDEVLGSGDKGKKAVTGGFRKASESVEVWGSGRKSKKTAARGLEKTSEAVVARGSRETTNIHTQGLKKSDFEKILVPETIYSGFVDYSHTLFAIERYYANRYRITMTFSSQISNAMRMLLADLQGLHYTSKWKIAAIAEWNYCDFRVMLIQSFYSIDISKVPLQSLLSIRRYVNWLKHRQSTQSSAAKKTLTIARKMKIISWVEDIFTSNEMAICLIVVEMENRDGFMKIDISLKNETLIELEWYYQQYTKELRDDLKFCRLHCLC